MSHTYKTIGINLKSIPLGENDRLLTILTPDYGIVKAVAPGARKYKSSLRGRSGLFVVNDLLIVGGRSLDRVIQAESIRSFPSLSQDLGKFTAGQYIAEMVLFQALSQHPQDELYMLVCDYLTQLEHEMPSATLAHLVRAIYAVLAYAGIAPQVFRCCATQRAVQPDFATPHWRVEFDAAAGGIVSSAALKLTSSESERAESDCADSDFAEPTDAQHNRQSPVSSATTGADSYCSMVRSPASPYGPNSPTDLPIRSNFSKNLPNVPVRNRSSSRKIELTTQLTAAELEALQQIAQAGSGQKNAQSVELQQLTSSDARNWLSGDRPIAHQTWLSLERVLRHYAQYHLDLSIRSATLIETCFLLPPS